MDVFSSKDLVNWQKHERIVDTAAIKWAWRAMWAPSIVEKDKNTTCFLPPMISRAIMKKAVLA
ncbi:hypothetical protein [Niabella hibiscisoli]|uniref:hypothetical protein n=1 Tax=Niabella hibiscisoli TaxID=1825928 RepID=UPI001F10186E|nr:hypothetical protein [Niabella hibiscisoli]MCH5717235.1 hypothetical protein [Niabella hibiscisoli]